MKYLAKLPFIFCAFVNLCISQNAMAEFQASYHSPYYLGAGLNFQTMKIKNVSVSSSGPALDFRKEFPEPKFSFGAEAAFIISSSMSLIGAEMGGHVSYCLLGNLSRADRINFDHHDLLTSEKKQATDSLFFNLGFSMTPIFGSTSTTNYSGPYLGLSYYSFKWLPLEFETKIAKQSAGTSSLTSTALSIKYLFIF